jgi:hypothetical protein
MLFTLAILVPSTITEMMALRGLFSASWRLPHFAVTILFCLFIPLSLAQVFQRDFTWKTVNGVEVPCWNPDPSTAADMSKCEELVYPPDAGAEVELMHNCAFMTNICQNLIKYLSTPASQNRR